MPFDMSNDDELLSVITVYLNKDGEMNKLEFNKFQTDIGYHFSDFELSIFNLKEFPININYLMEALKYNIGENSQMEISEMLSNIDSPNFATNRKCSWQIINLLKSNSFFSDEKIIELMGNLEVDSTDFSVDLKHV